MKLQPVGRSLLVYIKKKEKKSLLITPDDASEMRQAVVVGVGEKVEAPVKEGDTVLLAAYCGVNRVAGTDEEPYFIIAEKEILGIVKE
jgi:co-chaperonin GroES (HSP10)